MQCKGGSAGVSKSPKVNQSMNCG